MRTIGAVLIAISIGVSLMATVLSDGWSRVRHLSFVDKLDRITVSLKRDWQSRTTDAGQQAFCVELRTIYVSSLAISTFGTLLILFGYANRRDPSVGNKQCPPTIDPRQSPSPDCPALAAKSSRGLSLVGLLCAILGGWFSTFSIPAIVCGHVAFKRAKSSSLEKTWKYVALASLLLGYLGLSLSMAAGYFAGRAKVVISQLIDDGHLPPVTAPSRTGSHTDGSSPQLSARKDLFPDVPRPSDDDSVAESKRETLDNHGSFHFLDKLGARDEYRTWTGLSGKSVVARYVRTYLRPSSDSGMASVLSDRAYLVLQERDGNEVSIPLDRLSAQDRAFYDLYLDAER